MAADRVRRATADHQGERGATLALTAMAMAGMLVVAAMVIDLGTARLTRRSLVPATDAAALAAAQEIGERPWDVSGACAAASGFLAVNEPEATMTTCTVTPLGTEGGRVVVEAAETTTNSFAEPAGGQPVIASTSAAAWGPPLSVTGLRPIGLCYDGSPDLQYLIDNPPSGPSYVYLPFVKTDPAACGGLPFVGNFLSVDFEGGASLYRIRRWLRDGYDEPIVFEEPTSTGCDSGAVCYERPYAIPDLTWELSSLVNSADYVALPIFDYADADQVHLVGVVRARIYGFYLSGAPDYWWLQLKVDPGLVGGTCCGPGGIASGSKAIALCGVDPGTFPACDPASGT